MKWNFVALIGAMNMQDIEKGLLKAFLLCNIQKLFRDLFRTLIGHKFSDNVDLAMEHYTMDSKILRLVIQNIIETGDYTLEGIAYYTRIPLDVILDTATGNNKQLTITCWARIVDLYLQVKPEVSRILIERISELTNERNLRALSLLREA